MQIKVLFYLVAVWESESLFKNKCSRLVLKDVRDGDNLRDSGKLFQRDAPLHCVQELYADQYFGNVTCKEISLVVSPRSYQRIFQILG